MSFGLPEAPQVPNSEELLRQKLAERSGIRSVRLGGLVTTPQEQQRVANGAETHRTEEARIELPGTQAARPELPGAPEPVRLPMFGTTGPKENAPAPRPKVHKLPDLEADQAAREARQREIMQRADRRQDLDTAVAAGAHGTVTRGEENAQPRADTTREADAQKEAARKRAVQAAISQAAVVEAEATGELVIQFAERAFEQDLGRPERVQEHLGHRSR